MKAWLKQQQDFAIIIGYWSVVFLSLYLLQRLFIPGLFNEINFLSHDAEHYNFIRENGYKDYRVVFFPLFPKIWALLNLSPVGISLFNGLLYLTGLLFLVRLLKLSGPNVLLVVTLPSAAFFFLPYSESVFFISSVVLLFGIAKRNWSLLLIGLFCAGISRPAFTVFLPALILLELVRDVPVAQKVKSSLMYLGCCLLALLSVGLIQYIEAGSWFTFFKEQALWGNRLQWPTLPLVSWSGVFITRVDGVAFLTGMICFIYVSVYTIKKIRGKVVKAIDDEVIFSLWYVAGITLSVLFFRGGMLFSLNRFVFATPFIIVIIAHVLKLDLSYKLKMLVLFFFSLLLYWLLFNSFVHLQTFLKFTLLSLYLVLALKVIMNREKRKDLLFWIYILITFEIQVYFFVRFLGNQWVA